MCITMTLGRTCLNVIVKPVWKNGKTDVLPLLNDDGTLWVWKGCPVRSRKENVSAHHLFMGLGQQDLVICPDLLDSRDLVIICRTEVYSLVRQGIVATYKPHPKFTPVLPDLAPECSGAYLQRESTLSSHLCKFWADTHFAVTTQTMKLW